jgi:MOSC domain-containing protein YiiM
MKLISVNVGLPRDIVWKGKSINTGIFKEPVEGRVQVRTLNLDGDRQADLKVHGGKDKAVYCYAAEHYEYWREELPGVRLPWGAFGENLTVEGVSEFEVRIGDRLQIGTAELVVTQPRMPCYKLAAKFESEDIIKQFLDSRRTGFYVAVLREGELGAGDSVEVIGRDSNEVVVNDITESYLEKNVEIMKKALRVDALAERWRTYFEEQLNAGER